MKENISSLRAQNKIIVAGRFCEIGDGVAFDNVASGFEISFYGSKLYAEMRTIARPRINKDYAMFTTLCVMIDDEKSPLSHNINVISGGLEEYPIAINLDEGYHTVRIYKTDDPLISTWVTDSFKTDGVFTNSTARGGLNILVYGDSITSGGDNLIGDGESLDVVPETGNGMATYATFAAEDLSAQINVFSRCGICLYPASSSDTEIVVCKTFNKLSALTLVDWDMNLFVPDVVVLGLGTNDELGDLFTVKGFANACYDFVKNLQSIYNKDILYVFTYGYMNKNNDVETAINIAVNRLEEHGINACGLKFPKAKKGHPSVEEHRVGGDMLRQLILSKMNK